MAKLETAYVDMDGVLCDLVTPAMHAHGRTDLLVDGAWPKGEYDLHSVVGVSYDEFWGEIEKYGFLFWQQLEPYHWMQELLDLANQAAAEVVLITHPTGAPSSSFGKHKWIQRHFGKQFTDFIITGAEKWRVAAPGRLLIDDCDDNVNDWIDRDGIGLLFPAQCNSGDGDYKDVLAELRRYAVA